MWSKESLQMAKKIDPSKNHFVVQVKSASLSSAKSHKNPVPGYIRVIIFICINSFMCRTQEYEFVYSKSKFKEKGC